MEASTMAARLHLLQVKTATIIASLRVKKRCRVLATLNPPPLVNNIIGTADKTVYRDNCLDRMATNYLSRSVQAASGIICEKSDYEGLVEVAEAVYKNFDTTRQRELVIEALARAVPRLVLDFIRMAMPQSQFAREYFAAFTAIFFVWLVGDCKVKESEVDGRREKNIVRIKKCRFLEETSCVGMCLNLCKVPSQIFVKETLGMPVNMVPNFEDMSCEMVFGQEPLDPVDDHVFKQPCYKLCKAKRQHSMNCSSE